ncbi:hypothetical protein HY604_02650 [Candidatus Peregrinibacteria bacterium]|nr:hypothetical protein [Candidatus Peregrinibacteria bacterium]
MKNLYILHLRNFQEAFCENRLIKQQQLPPGLGETIGKAAANEFWEKITSFKGAEGIGESFTLVLNAIADILNGTSRLVNKSVNLVLRGLDWGGYGIDRLEKKLKNPGDPLPLKDYNYEPETFFRITDDIAMQNLPEAIYEEDFDIKQAIEAHQKSAFLGYKIKELEDFYQPAEMGTKEVLAKLNEVRLNQGRFFDSDTYKDFQAAERKVALYKGTLENPNLPSSMKTFFINKLTEAEQERDALAPLVAYVQNWAAPIIKLYHFPPESVPPEMRQRLEFDSSKVDRFDLYDIAKKMGAYLAGYERMITIYQEEQEKWIYIRDEKIKEYYRVNGIKNADGTPQPDPGNKSLVDLPADKKQAIGRFNAAAKKIDQRYRDSVKTFTFNLMPNTKEKALVEPQKSGVSAPGQKPGSGRVIGPDRPQTNPIDLDRF